MSKYEANIVIIGAGSAGLVSAYIASAVKAKVILVEKYKMGGDCLNTGCVPSKALLSSAKMAHAMRRVGEYGLESVPVKPLFNRVMDRVQTVIKDIEPHDSVERYTELGVECIQGEAQIISPHCVQVADRKISTKSIIIASGARPFVPPIAGLEKVNYLTSDNIWQLKNSPKRLLVLGGGPIGCELSQAFAELGSQVIIVEMMGQLMGREDSDVAKTVENSLVNSGVRVLTKHKAIEIKQASERILVCENLAGENESNGKIELEFDEILIAVGRKANTDNLDLESLGIKLRKNGTIETDDYLRTAVSNIFACGDVTGPYQFTHTASHQAWYATVNALFGFIKKFKVDCRVIPWATFTMPEVARVGLNENDAKQGNIKYEISRYELNDLDRAIAEGQTQGFIKVLTVPNKDKIIGVTIVSAHAGDMIAEFVLAMKQNIGLKKLLGTIHLYPSWMEANKYVSGNWQRAHQPNSLLKWVKKLHNWRRG